jgi:hypothetical protein
MPYVEKLINSYNKGEGCGRGEGGEMTETMYAHVNK